MVKKDNNYIITTKVNYPNNVNLVSEDILVDEKNNIKEVKVKDKDNNTIITVKYTSIEYNPGFKKGEFELDNYVTDVEESEEEEECDETSGKCEDKVKESSSILEDIVYPLYVPADTYLSSKDRVDSDEGSRVILTFAGSDPFILVEEVSSVNKEMEVIPVSGDPIILSGSIGGLSNNSLYFTYNGIDYYLTSNTLDGKEMRTIAESITNGSSLVASTK